MSVQVSYKKQILFFIIIFFVSIAAAELIAKIWWSMIENCAFEDSEIYRELTPEMRKQMCVDSYQIQFSSQRIEPNQNLDTININSHGFRGQEITLEKPSNTYRIFAIGGSTMLGTGSTSDVTTIPGFLQTYFDKNSEGVKVEVINAGISGAWSLSESSLIKNKLLKFNPDLFIIYDGWNDSAEGYPGTVSKLSESWKNRWQEICLLGQDVNFDVIIIIQPVAGTGNKQLTEQEYGFALANKETGLLDRLDILASTLSQLDDQCTVTADFRNAFDDFDSAIFWDNGHVGNAGNKIIAKKMFDISLPIIKNKTSVDFTFKNYSLISEELIEDDTQKDTFVIIKRMVLQNYKTPLLLKYYFFNDEIVTHEITSSDKLKKPEINKIKNLSNLDLTYSYLPKTDFSSKNLENTNFFGSYLRMSNFNNSHLINGNFTAVNLTETDFTDADLSNSDLRSADMSGSIMKNTNFSGSKLDGIDFSNTDFYSANLKNVDLRLATINGADFHNADLSYADLSGHDLRRVFFHDANLSFSNFKDIRTTGENFVGSIMYNTDFNDSIIFNAKFSNMNIINTNFTNAILDNTDFSNSDLTGTDFSFASLNNVNFDNANLEDCIGGPFIGCVNHELCIDSAD